MKDYIYNQYDLEAAKKLDGFLPDRLFDTHMHVSHTPKGPRQRLDLKTYYADMKPLIGERKLLANAIVYPEPLLLAAEENEKSIKFLTEQLDAYPENVGEIIVSPQDTAEDIEKRLVHPGVRGFKCYHCFANRANTWQADTSEFLPEAAWEVANKRGMYITLHMVRDAALADEANRRYIKTMAKKYPNAVLILAHAARSFASWTVFDTVDELVECENVWFDFSAICEAPAMTYILKKVGVKRCMWGSDYPVSMFAGKAISIGDTFYWISEKDLAGFNSKTTFHSYHVGTEGLMATWQACTLADLTASDIEDFFYNNAVGLMKK